MSEVTIDDSEPLVKNGTSTSAKKSGLESVFTDIFDYKSLKMGVFIFVLFFIISSEIFVTRVLKNIEGTIQYNHLTNYGIIVQGIILSIAYILLNALVSKEVI